MAYIAQMPNPDDVVDGRYKLGRPLGQGSYGNVFHATDLETGDEVAIKIIRPVAMDQHKVIERFAREISVAQKLKHPNTVSVFRHGVHGDDPDHNVQGLPFLVMEYLDGQDLGHYLAEVIYLPLPAAAAVTLHVLAGLTEAHSQGIIHRDLKLENIFVARMDDGSIAVKLLDFGTVKAMSSEEERLTRTDMVMGTPQIMAPEQITGQRDLTPAVDVYAVGCLCGHLLTGKPLFSGRTQLEVAQKHLTGPMPTLPLGVEDQPIGDVIRRALARNANDRYKDAAELTDALREALALMGIEPVLPTWDAMRGRKDEVIDLFDDDDDDSPANEADKEPEDHAEDKDQAEGTEPQPPAEPPVARARQEAVNLDDILAPPRPVVTPITLFYIVAAVILFGLIVGMVVAILR